MAQYRARRTTHGNNHEQGSRYSEGWKYNGDFHSLSVFNQRVESAIAEKSALAECILKGRIKVREETTMMGPVFEHVGGLLTNLMLALIIVTSADPEGTRARMGNAFYEVISKSDKEKALLAKLFEQMDTHDYAQLSRNEIEEISTNLTAKFNEIGQIDKKRKDAITKEILACESNREKIKRFKIGLITPTDMITMGLLGNKDDEEGMKRNFVRTGEIPMRAIKEAMSVITKVVKKYMTNRLLKQTRFKRSNGEIRSGLEIYHMLQKPSSNEINNIVILTRKITELESKDWKDRLDHSTAYLLDLLEQRDNAIEEYKNKNKIKLSTREIYCICTTISRIKGNEYSMATNRALLNIDLSRFTTFDEWRDHIAAYNPMKGEIKKGKMLNTVRTKRKCFCCDGNHYLSQCKSSKLTEEWKEKNAEVWKQYGKWDKDEKKVNATEKKKKEKKLVSSIRVNVNGVEPKWILDSGAAVHLTGDRNILKNETSANVTIVTPAGEKDINVQGDVSERVRDVLYNPGGTLSLISVGKYLNDNKNRSIIFTRKGAYEITYENAKKIEYETKLATCQDHLYKMDAIGQAKICNVSTTNPVAILHQRLGHASPEVMKQLRKNGWINFQEIDMKRFENNPCNGCVLTSTSKKHSGHLRRDAMTRNAMRGTSIGHWHCDIMKLSGKGEFKNIVVFIDKISRYTHLYFTNANFNIDEAIETMQVMKETVAKLGHTIKSIRWDGEKAIWSEEFGKWCEKYGVERIRSTSGEQNLAEMKIKAIRTRAEKMREEAREWPAKLEEYLYRHAAHISNLLPTEALMGRTPCQEYLKADPTRPMQRLRKFGAIAYHRETGINERSKKNVSAKPHVFIGYNTVSDAHYLLWNPITEKISTVHDAKFIESTLTRHWYENLIRGEHINFSGGEYEMSYDILTSEDLGNSQVEVEEQQIIEHASESENENESENEDGLADAIEKPIEYESEDSDLEIESKHRDYYDYMNPVEDDVEDQEEEIESNEEKVSEKKYNLRDRKEKNYKSLNDKGVVIGMILPEPSIIKKPGAEFSIVHDPEKRTIAFVEEKKEKRHPTLLRANYPKAYEIKIPKNRKEMLQSEFKEEFLLAEKIEIGTVRDKDTITFVNEKKGVHKLGTRMIFDVKSDENGNITKFKARLVALGYDQRDNEYHEKYAPVARITTIMILLIIGWMNQMDISLLDFKGAYLHAERPVDKPIYVKNIPGLKTPKGKMNFLAKGLYGTLDAGNLWREEVEKLLRKHGFKAAKNDPCLFIKKTKESITYIATWVDDLLIVSNDVNHKKLKTKFEAEGFEISHFDKIEKYLGINVKYDKEKRILEMDQAELIEGLLNKTRMKEAKQMPTPMAEQNMCCSKDQPRNKMGEIKSEELNEEERKVRKMKVIKEMQEMNNVPFRSTLGSLSHLTRMTRPDIQFATFYHSRYQVDPGLAHWRGLKRILRYLTGTIRLKLKANENLPKFEMFCDSDYGGDPDAGKSTTGIIARMYGIPILVKSKIQRMNAKSSTNAEIIALCDAVEELIYIKNLLDELNIKIEPVLQVDNQPAIDTMKNQKLVKGNKHIMLRYYFVKDYVKKGIVKLKYVPSEENLADIMTKPMKKTIFRILRDRLMYEDKGE